MTNTYAINSGTNLGTVIQSFRGMKSSPVIGFEMISISRYMIAILSDQISNQGVRA